jgi:hypothetical protein
MRKRTKRKIMIIFHKEIQILITIKRYLKNILYLNFFLSRKNQKKIVRCAFINKNMMTL